ncbi:MAG: 2-amino-4-hydroxy-6-hydroxymethyldihydropteridine diphosphokinase, partial [Gammaproteobacteria bacterium]
YIGLGSNLENPVKQVQKALLALKKLPKTNFVNASKLYCNKPLGPQNQPDFVNVVAKLETQLSPEELLSELLLIEQQQGRQRTGERWGPRTLDLDIILYGDLVLHTPTLIIPHPGLADRHFWRSPLKELGYLL